MPEVSEVEANLILHQVEVSAGEVVGDGLLAGAVGFVHALPDDDIEHARIVRVEMAVDVQVFVVKTLEGPNHELDLLNVRFLNWEEDGRIALQIQLLFRADVRVEPDFAIVVFSVLLETPFVGVDIERANLL
jgi:hypothetical protein